MREGLVDRATSSTGQAKNWNRGLSYDTSDKLWESHLVVWASDGGSYSRSERGAVTRDTVHASKPRPVETYTYCCT